jgi:uncharacterized protein (TIGR03083 family)
MPPSRGYHSAAARHDHQATRAALSAAAGRGAALMASLPDLDRPVPRSEWTLADVAAHLVIGFQGYTDAALGEAERWRPHIAEGTDFSERVRTLNQRTLGGAPRLEPAAAGAAIEEAARLFLEATAGLDPALTLGTPWYGDGAAVSLAAATALLLGEQLMHGRDVAHGLGRRWPITGDEATLVLEAMRAMIPLAVNPARAGRLTASYELRVGPLVRFVVRLADGRASVEESAGQAVDCRIAAQPVALLLVAYGRMSQWQAIARGRLMAWGRRPWLGPRFPGLFFKP